MKLEEKLNQILLSKTIMTVNDKVQKIFDKSLRAVPVDTGFLKSGPFKRTLELNNNKYKIEIGFGAMYAPFVDRGTYKMEARKYFTPFVYKEFGLPDPTNYQ